MTEVLLDTLLDTLKLIPFLFLTYLLMEYIEHKTGEKSEKRISRAGRYGPLPGALLGLVPQCGFSASAASLYSGGLISAGTLIAVFLSTSDEMIPILISEKVELRVLAEILLIKFTVAVIIGFAADILLRIFRKQGSDRQIKSLCQDENCHCEDEGIVRSAIHHTLKITLFILIITFALNTAVHFIGEDNLGKLFVNMPVAGCAVASLVGLIPNCAASVVITELYLSGIIGTGAMISGLLTGCGIGLLVLFRANKHNMKENIAFLAALYFSGVVVGVLTEAIGISI